MTSPRNFDEFSAAVMAVAKERGYKKKGLFNAVIGKILSGGIVGAFGGGPFGGGLSGMRYDSSLVEEFRARFEAHKDNPSYVARLVDEAANKLKNS